MSGSGENSGDGLRARSVWERVEGNGGDVSCNRYFCGIFPPAFWAPMPKVFVGTVALLFQGWDGLAFWLCNSVISLSGLLLCVQLFKLPTALSR